MQKQPSPKIQNVSTKGQIVVPAVFRKMMNITPKKKVIIYPTKDGKMLVLQPIDDPVKSLYGILADVKKSALQMKTEVKLEEKEYEKRKQ